MSLLCNIFGHKYHKRASMVMQKSGPIAAFATCTRCEAVRWLFVKVPGGKKLRLRRLRELTRAA